MRKLSIVPLVIGAASPFLVPQANAAFELLRDVTIEVRASK